MDHPLGLAIVAFYGQTRITSKYFLPLHHRHTACVFCSVVLSASSLTPDSLRGRQLDIQGPPPGEPW